MDNKNKLRILNYANVVDWTLVTEDLRPIKSIQLKKYI
jgi:hypothetical protein